MCREGLQYLVFAFRFKAERVFSRLPSDLNLKGLLPLVEPPDHNRRGVSVQSTVANINGHGPFLEKFRTYRLKRAGVAFVLNGLE